MKIVVTGSQGRLGKSLCNELERRGHEVWRIDHKNYGDSNYIRCNIAEYRQIQEAFNKIGDFDYLYHLGGAFGIKNSEDYYENVWLANVIGTRNILEIQKILKFKMIFTSSFEVYGERNNDDLYENLTQETYARIKNDYGLTKWVNEQQILNFQDKHNNQIVRCRPSNIYGPGEQYSEYRNNVIALFIYRAINNIPYTAYTEHHRDFIYIDDFTNKLANVCENFKSGEVYNIGGKDYASMKEVSDLILEILEKDDSFVEYKDFDPYAVKNKKANIDKAIRDLNHKPEVSLKEGIEKTINWIKGER